MSLSGGRAAPAVRRLKTAWMALVVAVMVLLVFGAAGCGGGTETKVVFLRDWEAAKEEAASQNKPIMVNFYTDT